MNINVLTGTLGMPAVLAALFGSATAFAQTIPVRYLVIPSSIGAQLGGEHGPLSTVPNGMSFHLPGYGYVRVNYTDFPTAKSDCLANHAAVPRTPAFMRGDMAPAAHFKQSTPFAGYTGPDFTWGSDTRYFAIFMGAYCAPAGDKPVVTYTFLNGAPDLNRLLLEVSGLGVQTKVSSLPRTKATISQPALLAGDYSFNGYTRTERTASTATSTTIAHYLSTPTGQDPFNTTWTLLKVDPAQATAAIKASSGAKLVVEFDRVYEDGIGTTLGYTQPSDGVLKVCKVAGEGVPLGQLFQFTDSFGHLYEVPAGPAPGGNCVVGPSYPDEDVTLTEIIPPDGEVVSIAVDPTGAIKTGTTPNLALGQVQLRMGPGVTEVTYTNKLTPTGYLEVCKAGNVTGNFTFTISGVAGAITVPAGACSPAIKVKAGSVDIRETILPPHTAWVPNGCSTLQSGLQLACNNTTRTSTVRVNPGGVSAQTIAIIANQPAP